LFPLIIVEPRLYSRRLDGGQTATAHAAALPLTIGSDVVFGVRLCAPSLLAHKSEVIEALLAHEFLHYVWMTVSKTPNSLLDHYPGSDWATYEVEDARAAAAQERWLSPRLSAAASDLHRALDADWDVFSREWNRNWASAGFATELIESLEVRARGNLVLDEAVQRRHEELEGSR
jgi:hypothetical protein